MQNYSNALKTKDGSFSFYSEKYNDFYHSTKDGAILETFCKHIIPTFYIANKQHLKILDICFGLGYNALFSLAYARRFHKYITIHSVELDLLERLRKFSYPMFLYRYLPVEKIIESLFDVGFWKGENVSIYLHKGDAKIYLESLVKQSHLFDIIYQDAFSPSKNADLWSEEHFKNLFLLLNNNGVISTYSSNKKVREICQKCGFDIYNMQSGNLKNGTIFYKSTKPLHLPYSHFLQSGLVESILFECVKLTKIKT